MVRRREFILATALAVLPLAGCEDFSPPTPPLLADVTAGGGWWNGGCPARDAHEGRLQDPAQEALSPELTARLRSLHPVGSDARQLERSLRDQGFGAVVPCAGAPAVRTMEFRQSLDGFFGRRPGIYASVAWEEREGRIMWTKGHVAFTDL